MGEEAAGKPLDHADVDNPPCLEWRPAPCGIDECLAKEAVSNPPRHDVPDPSSGLQGQTYGGQPNPDTQVGNPCSHRQPFVQRELSDVLSRSAKQQGC
jgi:hypothetical protein